MSNQELSIALRLFLESRGLLPGLNTAQRAVGNTTSRMKQDFDSVGRLVSNVQQRVAALGLGIGALQNQRMSAHLDQDLNRIGQTAGVSRKEIKAMREELFALSRDKTGIQIDPLKNSLAVLVASNLSWEQATQANRAINPAARVSGAEPSVLANAMTVGASAFKIDLTQQGAAVEMLDQMVVAGEAGKAELEDLAAIFGVAGNQAAKANLKFKDTLALIEVLADTTPMAQMPTMVDSTLRLFTNYGYASRAQKASGVPFFNKDGSRRDPADVLVDLSEKVQKAPDEKARSRLLDKILKGVDQTTVTGLTALFKDGSLDKMRDISERLNNSADAVAKRLPDAMDNAVAQAERLQTIMRKVGDDFAKPVNKTLSDMIEVALRPKAQGGLELSNMEVLGAGAATFAVAGVLGNLLRKIPIIGDTAGTAAGVVQGKALEQIAGVTPVFVTNWPGDNGGGGSPVETALTSGAAYGLGGAGALALHKVLGGLKMAGGAGLAGAAGWGVGSYLYDKIDHTEFANNLGGAIATVLAKLGNDEAQASLDRDFAGRELQGKLRIEIAQDGRARVASMDSTDNLDLQVATGPLRALGN